MNSPRFHVGAALAVVLCLGSIATGGLTWDGGGGPPPPATNDDWSNILNWVGGVVPGADNDVVFTTTTGNKDVDVDSAVDLLSGQIVFSDAGYTLFTSGAFSLTAARLVSAVYTGGTNTIELDVTITQDVAIDASELLIGPASTWPSEPAWLLPAGPRSTSRAR